MLSPLRLLVKSSQFAAGLMFFVLAPIWNQFPQYRLLASPLKWIFWKIPTHGMRKRYQLPMGVLILTCDWYRLAEWAIARLQAEAAFQSSQMQSAVSADTSQISSSKETSSASSVADPSAHDPGSSETVIGRYHCTSRNRHGNLTVTTTGVDFKQHLTNDRSWRLAYEDIKAMQKVCYSPTFTTSSLLPSLISSCSTSLSVCPSVAALMTDIHAHD